ncbi:hypothetical protein Stsp02_75830 [Streptomyces sp. NBRC 14336]|uniref:SDR family oxidoreductase n=1 Tax=Streptomyces sp. NBRC 14336 TaxID=3030992 RepID=UPI0024A47E29|nr:hypothetical protein Stsp02_75830 [Streptomyces sp. NBRC 14336]
MDAVAVVGGDGVQDALADVAELPDLRFGQGVEHQPAHFRHVARSSADDLGVPLVGQGGQGVAAVGRIGAAVDVALAFGRIVLLSSVSAERGGGVFGGVAYSAAKAALLGFARALARELGPSGVTVNSVAPGLIDTDITQGKLEERRKAAMIADVPVRRIGEVEDVADVIAFLARPESGYLTGVTYDVNGGSHMH